MTREEIAMQILCAEISSRGRADFLHDMPSEKKAQMLTSAFGMADAVISLRGPEEK